MESSEIKKILQSKYNRNDWLRFLVYVANNNPDRLKDTLHVQDLSNIISEASTYPVNNLVKIGLFLTSDNQTIPLYEIIVKKSIRLHRNRVGVNLFVKNVVLRQQGIKAALCIFKYEDEEIASKWRFSFVSKFAASQFFADVEALETLPKRYTFIFGTQEQHRTARDNFTNLRSSAFKIQDFFDAFSVEKVSQSFFDGYKEHYLTLVDEITNIKGNYITVFSKKDKDVRDFSKRLLGRIIFLYFLQKKKWLGSSDLTYKNGDSDFLYNLFKDSNCTEDGSDYYLHKLTNLFFSTLNRKRSDDNYIKPDGNTVKVPFLNGGLFDDGSEPKGYELIIIPNWVFKGLFDFLNEYNFTIDESSPEDSTVAVDPEMLGHIFENLLEDNKDKGAFYTPKEIVHYMCQESLIEYLTTHLSKSYTVYRPLGKNQIELFGNEESIGQLCLIQSIGDKALNRNEVERIVRNKDISELTKDQLNRIDQLLLSVKICDPAIGSGAFPMGLLQEIFNIKELIAFQTQMFWDPAKVKSDIIQKSIYGVDIEQGAVDIARLRFWLSLVVDEELPQPLPNLDYKIVTGNSLITTFNHSMIEIDWEKVIKQTDFFNQTKVEEKVKLLKLLTQKQKKFFDADSKEKKKVESEIRSLLLQVLEKQLLITIETKGFESSTNGKLTKNQALAFEQTLIWKSALKKIISLQNTNESFRFFDWKLNFPEVLNPLLVGDKKAGFDIVIGNPPYLRIQGIRDYDSKLADYLSSTYRSATGSYDLYAIFTERSLDLISDEGILNFIMPVKWTNAAFGKGLRKVISDEKAFSKIISFGAHQVFNASTYTGLQWFKKNKPHALYIELEKELKTEIELRNYLNDLSDSKFAKNLQEKYSIAPWVLTNAITSSILDKIKKHKTTVKDVFVKIFQGLATSKDSVYFLYDCVENNNYIEGFSKEIDLRVKVEKGIMKPLLKGDDVHRYDLIKTKKWVIFPYDLSISSFSASKSLYEENQIKQKFPLAYVYLQKCSDVLRNREKGRLVNDPQWYRYIYPKSLNHFEQQKIVAPDISMGGNFSFDNLGRFYSTTTNYSYILNKPNEIDYKYYLGILNSKMLWWFLVNTGTVLANGYFRFKPDYINPFPLPTPSDIQKQIVVDFVELVLYLKQLDSNNQIEQSVPNDHICHEFEEVIDALVFELYFPEEFKNKDLAISMPATELDIHIGGLDDKAKKIKAIYQNLRRKENPLRNQMKLMKIELKDLLLPILSV